MLVGLALLLAAMPGGQGPDRRLTQTFPEHRVEAITFAAIDVFVDPGQTPLGAYQLEIKAVAPANAALEPDVKLIGVEGGDGVYKAAPYYDPAALHENQLRDRI